MLNNSDVTLTSLIDRYPDVLGHLTGQSSLIERVEIEGIDELKYKINI
jgi:hypothetical protein